MRSRAQTFALLIFAAALIATAGCKVTTSTSFGLSASDLTYVTGKPPFTAGAKFAYKFKVSKFTIKEGTVNIHQSLKLTDPNGKAVLDKPKFYQFNQSKVPAAANTVTFSNNISLPKNAAKGKWKIYIKVEDKIGKGSATLSQNFEVK